MMNNPTQPIMAAFCLCVAPAFPAIRQVTCSITPPARHPSHPPSHPHEPLPLARAETSVLLSRMLSIALQEEDFLRAARIRDAANALERQEPTHKLRSRLQEALTREDYVCAAEIRDEIDRLTMHRVAERAKPRFPMGLVVVHRRLGYRMIVFGVDYHCRVPRRKAEDAGVGMSLRGGEQPWYHAAVDERDKAEGDNIVYVAEDDLCAAGEGVEVRHPITRIMFCGMYGAEAKGYSCYVPGYRDDDD